MVVLNFDSPEWPAERDKLADKLSQLNRLIAEECRLTGLRQFYRDHHRREPVVLCTGVVSDDDGPHLLNELVVPIDLALPLICEFVDKRIAKGREEMAQLLGELAG